MYQLIIKAPFTLMQITECFNSQTGKNGVSGRAMCLSILSLPLYTQFPGLNYGKFIKGN